MKKRTGSVRDIGRPRSPAAAAHSNETLLDSGIATLARAVDKDNMGQLEEALVLYREGIDLLMRAAREITGVRRQTVLKEVEVHMSRAEGIKAALAPPAPTVATPAAATAAGRTARGGRGGGRRMGETRPVPSAADVWGNATGGPSTPSHASGAGRGKTPASRRGNTGRNQPALSRGGGRTTGRVRGSGATGGGSRGADGVGARVNDRRGGASAAGAAAWDTSPLTELEQNIMADMLDRSPGVEWDSIAGLSYAKQTLQETVILPNLRPDLFTGLRAPSKGVLLYGPPGTGKTMLAKAVATESGYSFFSISASSLTSKWVGEGEKMVKALFSAARKRQPAVIFIDEIDSVLSARGEGEHEASRRLKTEFLVQLDGVGSEGGSDGGGEGVPGHEERLLVLAATNLPHELDEAALRRLSRRVYVPLPDPPARRALLLRLLRQVDNKKQSLWEGGDLDELVSMTEGYSGSDLKDLCKEAAMYPLRDLGAKVRTVAKSDIRAVSLDDFKLAVTRARPSVSKKTIEKFEEWERSLTTGL